MPDTTNRRPRFDRQAIAILQDGASRAMTEVPELIAVGLVLVWDLPDSSGLPAGTLITADNQQPDAMALLRVNLAAGRFQVSLLGGAMDGVARLHGHATELSRLVDHAKSQQADQESAEAAEQGRGASSALVAEETDRRVP